jgi:hypothetical protein
LIFNVKIYTFYFFDNLIGWLFTTEYHIFLINHRRFTDFFCFLSSRGTRELTCNSRNGSSAELYLTCYSRYEISSAELTFPPLSGWQRKTATDSKIFFLIVSSRGTRELTCSSRIGSSAKLYLTCCSRYEIPRTSGWQKRRDRNTVKQPHIQRFFFSLCPPEGRGNSHITHVMRFSFAELLIQFIKKHKSWISIEVFIIDQKKSVSLWETDWSVLKIVVF